MDGGKIILIRSVFPEGRGSVRRGKQKKKKKKTVRESSRRKTSPPADKERLP